MGPSRLTKVLTEVGSRRLTRVLAPSVRVVLENSLHKASKQNLTHLLLKRHLGSYVSGLRMQLPRVVLWEAVPADQMLMVNRLKYSAENLITFAGHCWTLTSSMNRSPLFPTDNRDGLLTASDAGQNRLKLPIG